MEDKVKVGPGMFVEYSYKLYDDADGTLLFETPEKQPDMMIYGVSQEVLPGLIVAMEGLTAGDKFGVTLPPAVGFGEYSQENVVELEREIFERDGELAPEVKEGALLPMMTAEGFRVQGKVIEVGPKMIKMDFNHPFAGKTVRFDGKIETVRPATPEELKPTGGCCGGCGGDSCNHDGCNNDGCGGGGCCH
ncbi:MAG: FKBP-type peptidyl-prolyl cis-trans isomerase [Muribaculaceae bacterium]|nr:FKBP-type peptidyl-prolyl cis-trans isomerase [Muribaculaceae bacterium]